VAVNGGAVTLVGHVGSFAEKSVAILAARRINGVTAVIDELEVRFMEDSKDTDEQIAQRAFNVIRWDAMLPPTIKVTVRHGLVMLSGLVDWYYQRVTAEENVRGLAGIKGVINELSSLRRSTRPTSGRKSKTRSNDMPKSRLRVSEFACRTGATSFWKVKSGIGVSTPQLRPLLGRLPASNRWIIV
jgi:osmotically-inducible protein OsmY